MNETRPFVGIDLGSSAVSVVVAELEGERLVVRGCGLARHDGARKGVIANLEEVSEAVRLATEEAEAMASLPVEVAVVGIGGVPIRGVPSTASVPVTGRDNTVTGGDLQRALSACAQVSIPEDFRVLDIIPCGFALDGQPGLEHPVGMPGNRLDAAAYVLYTNRTHAETVEQVVNLAAVKIEELVYEPLAAAEAVLTEDEKELGCLVLDLGYATTEWLLYADGVVASSGAVPVAGRHFTADLAAMLKTTTAAAERTKRQIGAALDREGLETSAIEVPALGADGNQVHSSAFAAEVLHERARDLFISVHRVLVRQGLDRAPRAGVVLTGGGSRLDGLEEVAETIFGHRVRPGSPRGLAGLMEPVSGPEWAVACGLVRLHAGRRNRMLTTRANRGSIVAWLRSALGDFFEMGGGHDRV
ncbi:MAG: cell division protein FtsA [Thermoanaerobaculales bacterium]|jgi:cell division protein FtsA|nr:cell division protein FtsA [Thermoanaerobaculales bacterium]